MLAVFGKEIVLSNDSAGLTQLLFIAALAHIGAAGRTEAVGPDDNGSTLIAGPGALQKLGKVGL
jgi:hypothetical protein